MATWMPKAGWGVSALVGIGLLLSAAMKLSAPEPMVQNFTKFGFDPAILRPLGAVEAIITVLYLLPRTSFIGAILVTGYLGGAVCTHLRVHDPIFAPLILGILVWVGYGLRNQRLMREALGLPPAAEG